MSVTLQLKKYFPAEDDIFFMWHETKGYYTAWYSLFDITETDSFGIVYGHDLFLASEHKNTVEISTCLSPFREQIKQFCDCIKQGRYYKIDSNLTNSIVNKILEDYGFK